MCNFLPTSRGEHDLPEFITSIIVYFVDQLAVVVPDAVAETKSV